MFEPPCLYQDIIVTKVVDMLIIVTKLLHLDSLQGQCEDVARECQSRSFYQDSELYWIQASVIQKSLEGVHNETSQSLLHEACTNSRKFFLNTL